MVGGIAVGYLLRNRNMSWIHKIIPILIWLLLFILGVDVGNNKDIIDGLPVIGVDALIITLGAVAGSLLASWALWRWIIKNKSGNER